MDGIRATPMQYPILGLLADRLKKAQQFAVAPGGYANPPAEILLNLLGIPAVQQTMERVAYGEPLTTGRGMTTQIRPEVAEAAMTLLPAAAGTARVAERGAMAAGRAGERMAERVVPQIMERGGMPAGLLEGMAQGGVSRVLPDKTPAQVTDLLSYRGSHTAPGPDFGAPLYDLTGGGQMYPPDVYSPKAAQYYGGGVPYDQKAFDIAHSFKDKPNAMVTIYRAVPKEMSNSEKLAALEKEMAAYMKRGTLPKDAENYSSGSKWYDWAYDEREKLRNLPDEPANKMNINAGDWVTLTKEYAKDHGESALKGQYKILSKKVRAKDLWTNADSIHEFGYHPSE